MNQVNQSQKHSGGEAAESPPNALESGFRLCPIHRSIVDQGGLIVRYSNGCVACSLHERVELIEILTPFAAKDGSEDTVTVLRRLAEFYDTHYGENRVVWQPRTYFGRVQVISVLDALKP